MQVFNENIFNMSTNRIIELEQAMHKDEVFKTLSENKKLALTRLKQKIKDFDWLEFDDFLSAENAEQEFIIDFFYKNGYKDCKNNYKFYKKCSGVKHFPEHTRSSRGRKCRRIHSAEA